MKNGLGIWDTLTKVTVFLIVLAVGGLVVVQYLPLIRQNEAMRKEILRLENRIQQEEEANRSLRAAIEGLRNDPRAVERVARESLWYAKPGETVVRFQEPVTNKPPTGP